MNIAVLALVRAVPIDVCSLPALCRCLFSLLSNLTLCPRLVVDHIMSLAGGQANLYGQGGEGSFSWKEYQKGRQPYPQRLYDIIFDYHFKGGAGWDEVIDFGAGDCVIEPKLLERFKHVEATDASEVQLKIGLDRLRERGIGEDRLTTRQCKGGHHPGKDGSVDLITAATAVHWFDVNAFTADAYRLLKPGGTLAVWKGAHWPVIVAGLPPKALRRAQEITTESFDALIIEAEKVCLIENRRGLQHHLMTLTLPPRLKTRPLLTAYSALNNIDVSRFEAETRYSFRQPEDVSVPLSYTPYPVAGPRPDGKVIIEEPEDPHEALHWKEISVRDFDAVMKTLGREKGKKPWVEDEGYLKTRAELVELLGGEDVTVTGVFPSALLLARKPRSHSETLLA